MGHGTGAAMGHGTQGVNLMLKFRRKITNTATLQLTLNGRKVNSNSPIQITGKQTVVKKYSC